MNRKLPLRLLGTSVAGIMLLAGAAQAFAAPPVVVTPSNTQGWMPLDVRAGASIDYVNDPSSPAPVGALRLTTPADNAAKAQYGHLTTTNLRNLSSASYYTKLVSAPFPQAAASYQMGVLLNGGQGSPSTGDFTTLVFEPYQNPAQGAVIPGAWQKWNVIGGLFWSTRTVQCPGGTITGTAGGPATYTLPQIIATCPQASVFAFGVNIGTYNPGWVVETDLFEFDGTVYDFELDDSTTGGTSGGTTGATGGPNPGDTPELDSLILFGSGLTGIGGYALTRWRARRRTRPTDQ